MEKISSVIELEKLIQSFEIKQVNDKRLLKEQFEITSKNFKPINLIKNAVNKLIKAPDLKENLLNTSIGLITGYLSKKAVVGATHNPLTKLAGSLLQIGVTSIVSKNVDGIKSVGMQLINTIFRKKDIPYTSERKP